MAISDSEPIYEAGEFCEVCGGTETLGTSQLAGGRIRVTVCRPCHNGPRMKEWLIGKIEAALATDPNFERQPDGKWKRIA